MDWETIVSWGVLLLLAGAQLWFLLEECADAARSVYAAAANQEFLDEIISSQAELLERLQVGKLKPE